MYQVLILIKIVTTEFFASRIQQGQQLSTNISQEQMQAISTYIIIHMVGFRHQLLKQEESKPK